MKIQIQQGRLNNPASQQDEITDVFIDNQLIVAIGEKPADFIPDTVINATGQLILPGIIDIQCRVREPGFTHKANIASETRAAALNGVTSLCIPPDSKPITDNSAIVEQIHHSNQKAGNRCHIYTIGAITKKLNGEHLSNMGTLKKTGCVALSNARRPFINNLVQLRAMEYASGQNMLVIIEPYDQALYANGCAHEGALSTRLGLPPIPEAAETAALAKDIELVAQTGTATHFGQLSCARSVDMIRQAKKDGLPVTADVSMHQLFLTDRDIDYFDTNKLTIPPLRSEQDKNALRYGLQDGTIDCICSDHQPHDADAKLKPFPSAEPGISALDTLLPLLFKLVSEDVLDLSQALNKLTLRPAEIFALPAGQIAPGELADIILVDDQCHYQCDTNNFHSAGKNSPFNGWDFTARVTTSIVAGNIIN